MNYYIGGPARVGKSVLAERVRLETGGERVHCDSLKYALKAVVTSDTHPDIFEKIIDPINETMPPDAWVDRLYRRDKALWPYFKEYVKSRNRHSPNTDQIVDGNIWPDILSKETDIRNDLGRRAVFLVDTSPLDQQAKRLQKVRDGDGENNWMKQYTNEQLSHWVVFNMARSLRYRELCDQTDLPCFDVAEGGIEAMSIRAFEYLVQKEVY